MDRHNTALGLEELGSVTGGQVFCVVIEGKTHLVKLVRDRLEAYQPVPVTGLEEKYPANRISYNHISIDCDSQRSEGSSGADSPMSSDGSGDESEDGGVEEEELLSPPSTPTRGMHGRDPLGATAGSLNMATAPIVGVGSRERQGRAAAMSKSTNPPPATPPVVSLRPWRGFVSGSVRSFCLESFRFCKILWDLYFQPYVVLWIHPSYMIYILICALAGASGVGWLLSLVMAVVPYFAWGRRLLPGLRLAHVAGAVSTVNYLNAIYTMWFMYLLVRKGKMYSYWVAGKISGIKMSVETWFVKEKNTIVPIFGIRVPRLYVYGVAVGLASLVAVLIYALDPFRSKKKKEEAEQVVLQSGFADYCRDSRQKALLHASLFVASLVSFGSLKSYNAYRPFVNFLDWMGHILPGTKTGVSGCAKSATCPRGLAAGDSLCPDCASFEAMRTLDNPRFTGVNAFNCNKSYAALCEDLITKTSIDWFLAAPPELQRAIVGDEEILADIKARNIYVHIDASNSKPFIRSRRDPMTIASLKMNRVWANAGLLASSLEKKIDTAEIVSGDMGLGWRVSRLPSVDENPEVKDVEELSEEDQIHLLSGDPTLKAIHNDGVVASSYWIFLKDGVLTLWKECPVRVYAWKNQFKTWVNKVPGLSSVLALVGIIIAMTLVYMAYTMTYESICEWISSKYDWWSGTPPSEEVDCEGRGIKSGRVKRAEPSSQKAQHRQQVQTGSEVGGSGGKFKERFAEPISDAIWRRNLTEFQDDKLDIGREKYKNFVFYDIQSVETQVAASGLEMINPANNQRIRVHNMDEYAKLRDAGWVTNSASITGQPVVSIPLEVVRSSKDLQAALKAMQYLYNFRNSGHDSRIRLTVPQVAELEKHLGKGAIKADPRVRAVFALATSPLAGGVTVSRYEREQFSDFVSKGSYGIDGLDVESASSVVFQGPKKALVQPESNIQVLSSKACANEANGRVCKVKDCQREHLSVKGPVFVEEALIRPEKREIDPECLYSIFVKNGPVMVRQGLAVSAPYGLITARHVLYDQSGELLFPLEDIVVVDTLGEKSKIDPKTISCPRTEQLSPGQVNDFCKFRCVDADFNRFAQSHRASLRNYKGLDKTVRLLRWNRQDDHEEKVGIPTIEWGEATNIDPVTGVVRCTINTEQGDSGGPVFDADGHCIGIHQGHFRPTRENVFIMFYPNGPVTWFVQAEPKN